LVKIFLQVVEQPLLSTNNNGHNTSNTHRKRRRGRIVLCRVFTLCGYQGPLGDVLFLGWRKFEV